MDRVTSRNAAQIGFIALLSGGLYSSSLLLPDLANDLSLRSAERALVESAFEALDSGQFQGLIVRVLPDRESQPLSDAVVAYCFSV